VAVLASLAITALAFLVLGGHGPLLVAIELVALAVMVLVPRRFEPIADRWARGAQGERHAGAILEDLGRLAGRCGWRSPPSTDARSFG
jgi:hypothetical protein